MVGKSKQLLQVVNVNAISRISEGSFIKGEINSPNDIRLDGKFEGRIFSEGRVVVGENAEIKGDIICDNLDFWGKITGNIFVKDTLTLKDTCSVKGEIHVKRLAVELGANFDGTCKMMSEDEFGRIANATEKTAESVN